MIYLKASGALPGAPGRWSINRGGTKVKRVLRTAVINNRLEVPPILARIAPEIWQFSNEKFRNEMTRLWDANTLSLWIIHRWDIATESFYPIKAWFGYFSTQGLDALFDLVRAVGRVTNVDLRSNSGGFGVARP
jgi:hypothetical protein